MIAPQELKALQTRRAAATRELQQLRDEQRGLSVRATALVAKLKDVDAQLEAASQELTVSEHALLRFVERTMDVDLLRIAKEIADKVRPIVDKIGDGDIPIGDGLRAIVRNKCVVSVVPV
jgi:multidrug efflux pump subunit AcrA (membrane-fusion protein)